MKIHFFGALAGNQVRSGNKTNYERIVDTIESLGGEVITRHYLTRKIKDVLKDPQEKHEEYVKKMTNWIKKADIVVVEVTMSEIGTGFELALAVNEGKPVIALYTEGKKIPILGCEPYQKLIHLEYNAINLKDVLKDAIKEAQEQMDVRFNFFVPPQIVSYLDWITKHRKLPRAVFLRRLIEEHMKRNKEYKAQ